MTQPAEPTTPASFTQNTVEENPGENTPGNFAGRGFAVSNTARLKSSFPGSPIYIQQNEELLSEEYRTNQRTNSQAREDGKIIDPDALKAQAYYGFSTAEETAADFDLSSVDFVPEIRTRQPSKGESRFLTLGQGHIREGSREAFSLAAQAEPDVGIAIPTPSRDSRLEFYPESWNELTLRPPTQLGQEENVTVDELLLQNTVKDTDRADAQVYHGFPQPNHVDLSYSFSAENMENDALGESALPVDAGPSLRDVETLSNHMRTPILDAWNQSEQVFDIPEPLAQLSRVDIGTVQGGIESTPAFGSFTSFRDYLPALLLITPIPAQKMGFAQAYYNFNSSNKVDLAFSSAPNLDTFDDITLEALELIDTNGNPLYSRFIPNPKPPENFNPVMDNQDLIEGIGRPTQAISPMLVQNPSNTSAEIKQRNLVRFNAIFANLGTSNE